MRRLLALLLMLDGLQTEIWVAGHVETLGFYGWTAAILVTCSALVGATLFTGGRLLWLRRPAGEAIAAGGLAASLVLTILEVGFGLAPNGAPWSARWWFVCGYAVYVIGALVVLRSWRDR